MNFLSVVKVGFLFTLCTFLFQSCGDSILGETYTFVVEGQYKEWLTDTTNYKSYSLEDNYANVKTYSFSKEWSAFNISISGDGFDRLKEETQTIHQSYRCDNGANYEIVLEASEPPEGNILTIRLDDLSVEYDLRNEEIRSIYTQRLIAPYSYNEGNQTIEIPIKSRLIFHSTYSINDLTYNDVLELNLLDFQDEWEESTITEFLYAKNLGLLRYSLNDGTVISRISQ